MDRTGQGSHPSPPPSTPTGIDRPWARTPVAMAAARRALITTLQNAHMETAGKRYLKTNEQVETFLNVLDAKKIPLNDSAAVAHCFRCTYLRGAPRQAQTRVRHEASKRRPAGEVTGDSADALLELARGEGPYKGKSSEFRNAFATYMVDQDTNYLKPQEVSKAYARFLDARPVLHKATRVQGGALQKTREQHLRGPEILDAIGQDGQTQLMRTVKESKTKDSKTQAIKVQAIKHLLDIGADPTLTARKPQGNIKSIYGDLQKRATRYLDSKSAGWSNPPVDFVEDVVLHLSPSMDNFTPELRFPDNGQNALTMAIDCGAPKEVIDSICIWTVSKKQGEKGWNLVNQRDGNGNLPLTLAAETSNSPACVILLASQAEINAMNDRNRTPLMLAAQKNNLELVTLLMDEDANCLPIVPDHVTPLSLALVGVNKKEVKARAELLVRLLSGVEKDFERLCHTLNETREAGGKSDAEEVLIGLVQTLGSFESDAFDDVPKVKAHAADCLTGCLTIATNSLSGVELLELLPHLKGPALDGMESIVSAKLPVDLKRMIGPPAASVHLWIKACNAFDTYAEL
ncbi:MAG TPA: ankyrin repeat domain-containing protein, partial [Beijerinckiaceae bacterium]|nr:ankyrin repeat domain-containing protein [Beijerinckiaceae bacterium]